MAEDWENTKILRDQDDNPIPQIWDSEQKKFVPYEGQVKLTGSYVEIGGVSFAVSGGDTLRNTAANKPNADAAHAAIPFCYYYAVDTGVVEVTDGTNWVVV